MKTRLWIKQTPQSSERLLNTIGSGSRFKSTKRQPSFTEESQQAVARELADGWKTNGPWPTATFRIETTDK